MSPAAAARDAGREPGRADFLAHCAHCHGEDGRGLRVVDDHGKPVLLEKPVDLTTLRLRYGVFPRIYVHRMIEGNPDPSAENRIMPHWGAVFRQDAGAGLHGSLIAPGRIVSLVEYIEALQAPPPIQPPPFVPAR